MPIRYVGPGDLTEAQTQALVITVNCVGAMGKGVALDFKRKFPKCEARYVQLCKVAKIHTGRVYVTRNLDGKEGLSPSLIVLAPTKGHWRWPSKIEWVESICVGLREAINRLQITSLALPPLGCGNGGLNWPEVRALVEKHLGDVDGCDIVVYGT